jgi:hypothetical protein
VIPAHPGRIRQRRRDGHVGQFGHQPGELLDLADVGLPFIGVGGDGEHGDVGGGVQDHADRLGPGILGLLVWVVAGAGAVAELGLQVGVDLAGLDEVDQAWRSMSRISTGIVPTAPTV